MKSIFSTQNLQTFFLRKYCRFPRGRPPGPPGPPGPPSRRGPPCPPPCALWPPSRRGDPPGAGACFCSSAIRSTLSLLARPVPGSFHVSHKKPESLLGGKLQTAKLGCRGCLFGRRCRRCGRSCRPARTPCGALLALQRELLLPLQVFVQAHGLILDHRILHAQAPLQLRTQLAVRGMNLLVNINPFAMFGHAIGQLPRSPVFGLLDLATLFRTSMLDDREHLLNLLFRSRRAHNKNQIVQTFFHHDLVPSTPGHKARQYRLYFSSGFSDSAAFRRLY